MEQIKQKAKKEQKEKIDHADTINKTDKTDKAGKTDKTGRTDKTGKTDKAGKTDQAGKIDKTDTINQAGKIDKTNAIEKAEKIQLYDKDIREPLFDFMEELYGKVRIIEEKRVGHSRADVVMVLPQAVSGIEIKSDADTYARLAGQVEDYDRYFDYNFVAVGSRHAQHVSKHIPEWWGIVSVELIDGKPDFYIVRMPRENPKVDWNRKMELLWRPELAHIQERNRLPRYAGKSKAYVKAMILERVPKELLRTQISDELFERDYTTIENEIQQYKMEKKRQVVQAKNKRKKRR